MSPPPATRGGGSSREDDLAVASTAEATVIAVREPMKQEPSRGIALNDVAWRGRQTCTAQGPTGSGKEHVRQRDHRPLQAFGRHHRDTRQAVEGLKPHRMAEPAVTRTLQSIRLFPDMTVLDNGHGRGFHLQLRAGLGAHLAQTRRATPRRGGPPPQAGPWPARGGGNRDKAPEVAQNLSYGAAAPPRVAARARCAPPPSSFLMSGRRRSIQPEIHHLSDISRHSGTPGSPSWDRAPMESSWAFRRGVRARLRREDRRRHPQGDPAGSEKSRRPNWAQRWRTALLSVRSLRVGLRPCAALRGVDLREPAKARHRHHGSNGAGKTSTVIGISGRAPGTEGAILFRGTPITGRRRRTTITTLGIIRSSRGGSSSRTRASRTICPRRPTRACATQSRVRRMMEREAGTLPHPAAGRRRAARGHPLGPRRAQMAGHRARPHVRAHRLLMDEPFPWRPPHYVQEIADNPQTA